MAGVSDFIKFLAPGGGTKNNNNNSGKTSSGNSGKQVKKKKNVPKTAQDSIPYKAIYADGIIESDEGKFSKTYPLEDINFKIASQEEQDNLFLKYGDLLNMFGNEVSAEITIFNRTIAQEVFNDEVLIKPRGDQFDKYREEYNKIILDKMAEGKNNIVVEKYITVSVDAENYEAAATAFKRLDAEIVSALKRLTGADASPLDLEKRLNLLYDIYNSGTGNQMITSRVINGEEIKSFNLEAMGKQGIKSKDIISPPSIEFERDYFRFGDIYGQVLYLQGIQSYLSTDFIGDLNEMSCNMLTSVHYESLRQDKALKIIRNHIVNVNSNVIDAQKKATKSGYSPDLISPDLMKAKDDSSKLLSDMTSRNQKLFYVTLVVTHFADSLEKLKQQTASFKMIAQKSLVTMNPLIYQQEWGFTASLPIALNKLAAKRLLTTEQASVFIPFSSQELSQNTGFYYGVNAVSRNLILFDRLKLKNANGIYLGTPGSGKSFSAKREILNVLLATDADVFIIDPEREYAPLAQMLGGEVIRIAAGSKVYVNPLDMDVKYAGDDDPVTLKSDFICSLCETIFGGKWGLSESQKSIIDRCVREVYKPYVNYMDKFLKEHPNGSTCDISKMPTLKNLYDLLLRQDEPEAKGIALALERFVTGSLDTFAHRTNVNTRSRFVVYDIKDIGTGLKELGLQVCLNDVWNRTLSNRLKGKRTWFYIDEFYLLTQTDSSARFLQEIFKRARKWGGVPTGITQNVEDMLVSKEARTIIANCDFVVMLNQAPNDKVELAKMFNISPTQLSYITGADVGQGLLYVGKIVPFIDKYPHDTISYKVMSTKIDDLPKGNIMDEIEKTHSEETKVAN